MPDRQSNIFAPVRNTPRRRQRRPGQAAAPPALLVVGVTAISVIGPELEMNVMFNTTPSDPIGEPTTADPTKWTARYQGQKYVGSLIAGGDFEFLYLQLTPAGAEAGPDVLNYANAPSDVSDSLGRFLSAFAGLAI